MGMMPSRLALLGPVRLTGPTESSMRRATQQRRTALLALIASAPGESISRDRLLGLLWPDRDERSARHLLADSLYVLRRSLGDGAIVVSGEMLRLTPEFVSTDVADFRVALAEERWSDALDVYCGDFLDGFIVRNAVEFDQWALTERTRMRGMATRAAVSLATRLEQTGRLSEAAAAAERALELAPCDETLFRNLIRLLTCVDNPARAEEVARSFIERLAFELGVSPSRETMRVVREARGPEDVERIVVETPPARRQIGARTVDSATASIIAQGRHHWHQRTRSAVERAITYFTRAVERDVRAIDAWCGLADCWIVMGGRGYAPIHVAIERGAASAERALAIDDTRSSTHASIGGLQILRRRWNDAESALRCAILIDPQNGDAHHWLALTLLTGFGARDAAIREQSIAAGLNPVSPIPVGALGWQRYLSGAYDLSRSSMEPALDLNADLEEGHAGLARIAARLGDERTVMRTIAAGLERHANRRGDLLAEQSSALAVLGDMRRARMYAFEAVNHRALPMNLALAWASLGEVDRALECLARESFLVYWAPQALWWDPRFDPIRDDARFARVHRRVKRQWSTEWS